MHLKFGSSTSPQTCQRCSARSWRKTWHRIIPCKDGVTERVGEIVAKVFDQFGFDIHAETPDSHGASVTEDAGV